MLRFKQLAIFLLFSVVAVMIMAPIASHEFFRHGSYTGELMFIEQARAAILSGSMFWLRVGPDLQHGWLYPVFQFYSSFPFMVAGYLAIFLSHNPLDPFKFTLGIAAVLGAWYSYKLYVFLFEDQIAALLGAVLYMFSPYLLININVRDDFSEAVSQGIFPMVLYYAFRVFYKDRWDLEKYYFFLFSIFAFYIFIVAHLITFIYCSLFAFVYFFSLAWWQKRFKNLLFLSASFFSGILLAAWYFIPMARWSHITRIGTGIGIGNASPGNDITNDLTHISSLLAPKGINAAPSMTSSLCAGLSLLITVSIGYWLYRLWVERNSKLELVCSRSLISVTLGIIFLAIFMLWTPFNFWQYLPKKLYVIQFSFRLMTQVMWLGGILFVAMLSDLFKRKLTAQHLWLGLFVIALSGAGWMYSVFPNDMNNQVPDLKTTSVNDLAVAYNTSGVAGDDLVTPAYHGLDRRPQYSLATNKNLINVFSMEKNCQQQNLTSICSMVVGKNGAYMQLPVLFYPQMLEIKANGKAVVYYPSDIVLDVVKYYPSFYQNPKDVVKIKDPLVLAAIYLPEGTYKITSQFVGVSWANFVSVCAWFGYFMAVIIVIFFALGRQRENKKT